MAHIGIGPVLQEARVHQGKSIEEASRETRIRAEYLQALEGERFDALVGDVYARAFLRSYSVYLGLDASHVLSIYTRHFGDPYPLQDTHGRRTWLRPRPRPDHAPRERRLSWRLVIAGTAVVIALLAAVGLLARASSPKTGAPGRSILALPPTVTVSLKALQPVRVTVTTDQGTPASYLLREDESRTFQASTRIGITIDHGGLTEVIVNGFSLGTPGQESVAYSASYTPRDYRSGPSGASP